MEAYLKGHKVGIVWIKVFCGEFLLQRETFCVNLTDKGKRRL